MPRPPIIVQIRVLLALQMAWIPVVCAHAVVGFSVLEKDGIIRIQAENAPLGEVIQEIEKATGIHFYLTPEATSDPITREIEARDWKTALRKLLDGYNRLELWDKNLDASEIHILSGSGEFSAGSGQDDPETDPEYTPHTPTVVSPKASPVPAQPTADLNRDQLLLLSKGRLRDPLPKTAFNDPKIKSFLDELKVNPKSNAEAFMRARIKARRLLRALPEK